MRHSHQCWALLAVLQVFPVTSGTLATLAQEMGPHGVLCIAVTHTPSEGIKAGDLTPHLLCRLSFGDFPTN